MCLSQNTWLILLLLLFAFYIIISKCNYENFNANDIPEPDISTYGKSLCSSSTNTFMINKKTMITDNFIKMSNDIKQIVIDMIIEYAKKCNDMNGDEKVGITNYTLTLACNNDPEDMEQNIVNSITEYIRKEILNKYNVKINRLIIIHDLMKHLNLLEHVIYPLYNSKLYTLNDMQYITVDNIKKIVSNNLEVNNVLYTIITRGNISVIENQDKNI